MLSHSEIIQFRKGKFLSCELVIKVHLHLYRDKKYQPKKHQPVTVVVAVEGGVGWWGGAVVEGAVTIVAAEEDDEGPKEIQY